MLQSKVREAVGQVGHQASEALSQARMAAEPQLAQARELAAKQAKQLSKVNAKSLLNRDAHFGVPLDALAFRDPSGESRDEARVPAVLEKILLRLEQVPFPPRLYPSPTLSASPPSSPPASLRLAPPAAPSPRARPRRRRAAPPTARRGAGQDRLVTEPAAVARDKWLFVLRASSEEAKGLAKVPAQPARPRSRPVRESTLCGGRRVQSVRGKGRDVSSQYGGRDETCPVSTGGGESGKC